MFQTPFHPLHGLQGSFFIKLSFPLNIKVACKFLDPLNNSLYIPCLVLLHQSWTEIATKQRTEVVKISHLH